MPTLYVMVGLPGSGKSTFLEFIDDPEFNDIPFVYSTDRYIEKVAGLLGRSYNQVFKDYINLATKYMNDMLTTVVKQGTNVYWDQTNMSSKKRIGILSRFPKTYHKVCYCIVPPRSADEWAELNSRILLRAEHTGKMIPPHIVESMADTYVEPTLDEGFDEVYLYDIYGNKIMVDITLES